MSNLNKVLLIGRLGAAPEMRYTQSGNPVANFSMATSDSWGSGDERKERTEWHRIVVWGRQAEAVAEHLGKGSLVFVEGRLQTRKWEDRDGKARYTTEIVARDVRFLDRKGSGGGVSDGEGKVADPGDEERFEDEDEIPF